MRRPGSTRSTKQRAKHHSRSHILHARCTHISASHMILCVCPRCIWPRFVVRLMFPSISATMSATLQLLPLHQASAAKYATRDTRHATRDTRHTTHDTRHAANSTQHTKHSTQHTTHTAKLEEVHFCRPLKARLLIDERLFTNSQRISCRNLATVNDTTNTSSFSHHEHRTSTDKSHRRNDGEKFASHVVGTDVCLPGRVGVESPPGAVSASSIAAFRASQTRSKPALKSVFF